MSSFNQKKDWRFFMRIFLSFALAVTLSPFVAFETKTAEAVDAAQVENTEVEEIVSGDLSAKKQTKSEIIAKQKTLRTYSKTRYVEEPSITSPYSTGSLPQETLDSAQDRINWYRYLAGLPDITFTDVLNKSSQYAAVVAAANNVTITHYPTKPADMDDEFYRAGAVASKSSNGAQKTLGTASTVQSLRDAVDGCMNEESSETNLKTVGHRRWFLHPNISTMGAGSADAPATQSSTSGFSNCYSWFRVMNNDTTEADGKVEYNGNVDYDAIAWPPSGNVSVGALSQMGQWSITLNPDKWEAPSADTVSVTLVRKSDNKTWEFNKDIEKKNGSGYNFSVNNEGYGVKNCIIWRPSDASHFSSWGAYTGEWQVTISGVYKKGETTPTTITYPVNFFYTWKGLEITDDTVSVDAADISFNGKEQRPTVSVATESGILTEGEDYTVDYSNNIKAGTATVTVTGLGAYTGTVVKTFEIKEATLPIDGATVSAVSDTSYTGLEQTPEPTVELEGNTLVKDTDYTIAYENNLNAGEATLTIAGIGDYEGTITRTWTINKVELKAQCGIETIIYGEEPELKVNITGFVNGETSEVLTKVPYARSYWEAAGTYFVTPTGGEDENYDFRYSAGILTINKRELTAENISDLENSVYTGLEQTPDVTVSVDSKVFEKDKDYTIAYENNKDSGTATVKITGIGSCTGEVVKTFEIAKAKLTATYVGESIEYGQSPKFEVELGGFVNDEDSSVLEELPSVSTTEAASGTYTLTPSGGKSANYYFEYVSGVLTIAEEQKPEPEVPEQPEPVEPEPEQPDPVQPEPEPEPEPVQPEQPETPEQPEQPEQPEDPVKPTAKLEKITGLGTVKINGETMAEGAIQEITAGQDMTIAWKPAQNGTNITLIKSIKVNGVEQKISSKLNKTLWERANNAYRSKMDDATSTMVTYDSVSVAEQSITISNNAMNGTEEKIEVEFAEYVPVYRLYNQITSEHLFTTDKTEYDAWVAKCDNNEDYWIGEGIDWFAPTTGKQVYRLYNPDLGAQARSSHYYTSDEAEIAELTTKFGWVQESIEFGFMSGGDVPIWTCYNEGLGSAHHYTSSKTEWEGLAQHGWQLEQDKNLETGVFQAALSAKG